MEGGEIHFSMRREISLPSIKANFDALLNWDWGFSSHPELDPFRNLVISLIQMLFFNLTAV